MPSARIGIVRHEVESSSIVSAGYDASTKTFDIEYVSGSVYRYADVPPQVYARFLAADSKGRFVNTVIKKRYRFIRLS
jgi:hypothetical protein